MLGVLLDVSPQQFVVERPVKFVADETHQPALLVGVVVGEDLVSDTVHLHPGQADRAPLGEEELEEY